MASSPSPETANSQLPPEEASDVEERLEEQSTPVDDVFPTTVTELKSRSFRVSACTHIAEINVCDSVFLPPHRQFHV